MTAPDGGRHGLVIPDANGEDVEAGWLYLPSSVVARACKLPDDGTGKEMGSRRETGRRDGDRRPPSSRWASIIVPSSLLLL